MAISETQRHQLHTRLDNVLGEEDAAVLMSHLPPSGWSDVVRTNDLDLKLEALEARLDVKLAGLRSEMHKQTAVHLVGTTGVVGLIATLTQLFE